MLRKTIVKVIYIFCSVLVSYYIAIQAAYLLSFQGHYEDYPQNVRFFPDPKVMWWQGNNEYFVFVSSLIGIMTVYLIWLLMKGSPEERKQRAAKRKLTKEELLQYSHPASVNEIKKGLTRLHFNNEGELTNIDFGNKEYFVAATVVTIYVMYIIFPFRIPIIGNILASCMSNTVLCYVTETVFFTVVIIIMLLIHCNGHVRDWMDYIFDPLKKQWNELMFVFKQRDEKKFNTLKTYKIHGKTCRRRAGTPILTGKNTVYVDAGYNHTITVGTTNSGKTVSTINPLIQFTRMTGESLIVNDIKGELLPIHRASLEKAGYNIINLNFVDPSLGASWNPFSLVYRKYRNAQKKAEERYTQEDWILHNEYCDKLKKYYKLHKEMIETGDALKAMDLRTPAGRSANTRYQGLLNSIFCMKQELDEIKYHKLPQSNLADIFDDSPANPNNIVTGSINNQNRIRQESSSSLEHDSELDDAMEYLRDITTSLCSEENAKDDFWWKQSRKWMEGLIMFLLEYEYIDENGELCRLTEDEITFHNIKLLKDQSLEKIRIGKEEMFLMTYYLKYFRRDQDYSSMRMAHIYNSMPEETRGSVESTLEEKLDIGVMNGKIGRMLSKTSFDMQDIGKRSTAVFLTFHDEKDTYYPLMNIFISQLYEEVVKVSREDVSQMLPVPIHIIWDEFGISPALSKIDTMLSAMRFRGVRMTMVVQDYSQLESKYGKTADTIKANVMNTIFLLSGLPKGLKEISDRCGTKLVWNKERCCYDKEPTFTVDYLSKLSLGWAVVLRQRKNPAVVRYYPFFKYGFYISLGKPQPAESKPLPVQKWFSLRNEFDQILIRKFSEEYKNTSCVAELDEEVKTIEPIRKEPVDSTERNQSNQSNDIQKNSKTNEQTFNKEKEIDIRKKKRRSTDFLNE